MEGRAAARPDRSLVLVPLKCLFAGVCERLAKRELRRVVDTLSRCEFSLYDKERAVPRGYALTLALASDYGRPRCRQRRSGPHEIEALDAAIRRWA